MCSKQLGFSIVEGVIAVVVIGVLGFIGWRLYTTYYGKQDSFATSKNQSSKPKVNSTNNEAATTINPYAGWKTYCSAIGGICFKYPSNWQEKDVSDGNYVTVTSPSGAILVNYVPVVSGIGGACPSGCYFKAESIDQYAPPNSLKLEVIKGVFTHNDSPAVAAEYFLASSDQMARYNLQLNQDVNVGALYGVFTSPLNSSSSEELMVRVNGKDDDFPSVSDANAWLNNPEVKTAGEILTSVYVNQSVQTTYLNIKELGIKLPLSDDIKDLIYTYNNINGANFLHFSTSSIVSADPACSAENDPLGIYAVYTSEQPNPGLTDNEAGTLEAHINGYYIYYHHVEYACGNSDAAPKVSAAIPSLLTAIQNAQAQ